MPPHCGVGGIIIILGYRKILQVKVSSVEGSFTVELRVKMARFRELEAMIWPIFTVQFHS